MRAAAAAVLVLLLALPATAAQPRRATLKLASLAPLVVKGDGFGRRERVVVTASAPRLRRMLALIAGPNGAFTARFGIRLDRCAEFTVRAVGHQGSRAILQVSPACEQKKRRGPAWSEPSRDHDRSPS